MKFGLFTIVPWHESRTQEQSLREALEQIELADQLGLDEVWLGEHRFSRHGLLSGIFSFLGQVAARTSHVRIGTAVIVLPLHNPILVAEEVAMLDVLSGGRVNLGIGSGYQRQEFEGLGINMEESRERFVEAVEVMTRAWTEETLTYHGKFTNVDELWVLPKPLQNPHPPPLPGGEHQPWFSGLRGEASNSGHRWWANRCYGASSPSNQNVATKDGGIRLPPPPPRSTYGQSHLCCTHHGGGRV